MNIQSTRSLVGVTALGLGLSLLSLAPVRAAAVTDGYYNYNFKFLSDFSADMGGGTLFISPDGRDGFFTLGPVSLSYGSPDPSFLEMSGTLSSWSLEPVDGFYNLVGVWSEGSAGHSFGYSEGRGCGPEGGCYSGSGTVEVFLQGDRYDLKMSVNTREYNIFDDLIREFTEESSIGSGKITFVQPDDPLPVEAIPEPLTLLGAATAAALGASFKGRIRGGR